MSYKTIDFKIQYVTNKCKPFRNRYNFRTAFVPGRVSFRPRIGNGCDPGQCGATKWQFIGTNDE